MRNHSPKHIPHTMVNATFGLLGAFVSADVLSSTLEEVVVTAQKREESIQDVGIAITAFSGKQLNAYNITKSTDIAAFTPGVSLTGVSGGQTQQFTMRGVTQSDFFDLAEGPNAVYIDEAYLAGAQSQLFAQYDMNRVEILKGPQGTLFGRNATGGLVHYITNKPTEEFEAYGDISYGRFDTVRFEGAVSGALSDTVKARVSAFYRNHNAIYDNVYDPAIHSPSANGFNPDIITTPLTAGPPVTVPLSGSSVGQDDLWTDDQFGVRGQLLVKLNDDVEIHLRADYAEQEPSSGPWQSKATVGEVDAMGRLVNTKFSNGATNPNSCEQLVPGTTTCAPGSPFDLDVLNNTRPSPNSDFFGYTDPDGSGRKIATDHAASDFDSHEVLNIGATLKWDIDWATLVSVTSYSEQDKRQTLDVDSGPAPQFTVNNFSEIEWFSQELRLEGEADRYRWIMGAYYLDIDGIAAQNLADVLGGLNPFGASVSTTTFLDASLDADLETESYSFFGQIDYDLTERLTLSVGLRGIQEEKDFVYTSNLFINTDDTSIQSLRTGDVPIGSFLADHTESTDDFLWSGKVGLEYAYSDDTLFYFTMNRGVKAGSCNAPLLSFITPEQSCYDEEVLHAYEVGFKTSLMDGRARLNATAYYYDYSDYQAFQFVGTSGVVINADAEYYGGEIELFVNPVDNLDLIFGLSLLNATVEDIEVATGIARDVEPSYAPEMQFNALARYTWYEVIAGGSLAFQVHGNYVSESFNNINNFDTHKMESYWLGNANLTWASADEHWTVSAFVDNVGDVRNQMFGLELSTVTGSDAQGFGLPRIYGLRVRYNYF